ncbi:MAG: tetratricopeptide repeat protein [bacterium]
MKKILILAIAILFSTASMFAQSAKENVINNYKEKNFEDAAKYIEEAVAQDSKDRDLLVISGDVYFELENYNSAINMYNQALKIKSNDWEILSKLAESYSLKKEHQKAFEYYNKAIEKVKENSKEYYTLKLNYANALIRGDSLKTAELIITQVKSKNSKNPDAYVMLGNLYFAKQIYVLAENNYKEAIAIDASNLSARANLAESYYWLGNAENDSALRNTYYGRCLTEYNSVTTSDPKNAKAWLRQGKILFASGRYDDAASAMNKYIRLRPSDLDGRWILGKSMFEINRCDSAAINLEMVASQIDSLADQANLMLAQCNFESKNYAKSIEKYTPLYNKGVLNTMDQRRLGQCYFMSGDTLKAFELWTTIINLDPQAEANCKLMNNIVKLMTRMQLRTRAIEMGEKWLANSTCDPADKANILFIMGNNYITLATIKDSVPALKLEYATKSLPYLKESNKLDPANIYTYLYLGDAYVKLDSVPKGIEYYQSGIAKAKSDTAKYGRQLTASYQKTCGLYLKDKKYTELKKLAQEWTVDQPNSEWSWFYLAIAYHSLENVAEAKKYYKKVLAINPNNQLARKQITALDANSGE